MPHTDEYLWYLAFTAPSLFFLPYTESVRVLYAWEWVEETGTWYKAEHILCNSVEKIRGKTWPISRAPWRWGFCSMHRKPWLLLLITALHGVQWIRGLRCGELSTLHSCIQSEELLLYGILSVQPAWKGIGSILWLILLWDGLTPGAKALPHISWSLIWCFPP